MERLVCYFASEGVKPDDIAHLLGLPLGLTTQILQMMQPIFEEIDVTVAEQWRKHFPTEAAPPLALVEFGQACGCWARGEI